MWKGWHFLKFLAEHICFIYSELQKNCMQNVLKCTHDAGFSHVELKIIHMKTFFVKQEMSLYFATLTYWTPSQFYVYVFLFVTTSVTLTVTNHMGFWSHQLYVIAVKNTITIWTNLTNVFIIENFIQNIYLFNLCEHTICWQWSMSHFYVDWPAQLQKIKGCSYMNMEFVQFTTGQC